MSELADHKRELFDGMRAYHQSEISHAHHAITMLLAVSAAAGAVVVAILFPQVAPNHVREIAWGLWIVISAFVFTIAGTAHLKINGDHEKYADFGREYMATCKRLGFYELVTGHEQNEGLMTKTAIGQGKGYRKTQVIIWCFAGLLSVMTLIFALLVPRFP